jgi:hypothetical protein
MKKEKFTVEQATQRRDQLLERLQQMEMRVATLVGDGLSTRPEQVQSLALVGLALAKMAATELKAGETIDSSIRLLSLSEDTSSDDLYDQLARKAVSIMESQLGVSPDGAKQYVSDMLELLLPMVTELVDEADAKLQYAQAVLGGACCEPGC